MWSIEVTAPVSEVYGKLQEEFDSNHVPKEEKSWPQMRSGRATGETLTKTVNVPDEHSATQFRYLLKGIQNALTLFGGTVTVKMSGDDHGMTVGIEGKYA